MAIAVKFGASAAALIIGAGISPGSLVEVDNTSTFTVTTEPSDPYVGEGVRWRIEGLGGHTITNALMASANNLADVWVQTDVDDSGATYETTSASAEIARGRVSGHVYSTSGTKTPTVSSWVYGGDTFTQTFSFTVQDPDAETWDAIYYIDLNGSTTDMPAETGVISHITSETEFRNLDNNTSVGDKIRLFWRGGVTHTLNNTGTWTQAADIVHISTFGTGKATIEMVNGAYSSSGDLFSPRSTASAPRWIINNLSFVGQYDPVRGTFDGDAEFTPFNANTVDDMEVTMWRCTGRGLEDFYIGTGANNGGYDYEVFLQENDVRDYHNYALAFSGACRNFIARGNIGYQNPAAGMGDARDAGEDDYPDHAPLRVSRYQYLGISDNRFISTAGWSTGGSVFNERAIQDGMRIYMDETPVDNLGCIIGNFVQSRTMLEVGGASRSDDITNPCQILVACNQFEYGHNATDTINFHCGGVFVYSNMFYRPNLNSPYSSDLIRLLYVENFADVSTAAAYEEPGYYGFNTVFSDGGQASSSGGTITDSSLLSGYGTSPDYVFENNLVSGDNHTGTYVAASAFARGDNFRPITSSAADDTVSAGPPVDLDYTKRTGSTNKGCHHAAGSDVSVSSPTKPSGAAPTIAANVNSGEYGVTDLGAGWTNIDNIGLIDLQWQLDGTNNPNTLEAYVRTYATAGSGDLTCIVGRTNRSGVRVTDTSNTLAI